MVDALPITRRHALGFATLLLTKSVPAVTTGTVFDVTAPPFGADPTGRRNSTRAFAAASSALNAAGGGTLVVPPGTYLVGRQNRTDGSSATWSFAPEPIIHIADCIRLVAILGHGARLVAQSGLKFGSFDPRTGTPTHRSLPFTDVSVRATPYRAMIAIYRNTAPVVVEGFELDGNLKDLEIGGGWNDTGIQISGSGIEAYNNSQIAIADVTCRNHPLDGIMLGWEGLNDSHASMPHTLDRCTLDGNGRQGLSWVGGNALVARSCRFSRTGRSGVNSAPAAGVDIEGEDAITRNAKFEDCEFSDNAGVGLLVHRGNGSAFTECRFIGTTNWAAWPAGPGTSFTDCLFVGGVTNAYGDRDTANATRFSRCRFTADPSLTPRRQVYAQNYLTVEMDNIQNVLFDECRFDSGGNREKGLIYANGGVFRSCRFKQDGPGLAVLRGRFSGRNVVTTAGQTDFYGAKFDDMMQVNGRPVG